jgi:hypothetical protein
MTVVETLDSLINKLNALREDAAKVDAGKSGAPGTRVRKAAGEIQNDLQDMRKQILEARKSEG